MMQQYKYLTNHIYFGKMLYIMISSYIYMLYYYYKKKKISMQYSSPINPHQKVTKQLNQVKNIRYNCFKIFKSNVVTNKKIGIQNKNINILQCKDQRLQDSLNRFSTDAYEFQQQIVQNQKNEFQYQIKLQKNQDQIQFFQPLQNIEINQFYSLDNIQMKSKCVKKPKKSILKVSKSIEKKKVRLILPDVDNETLTYQYQLVNKLIYQIKLLISGKKFIKCCFDTKKYQHVYVYFSMDFKFCAWKLQERSQIKIISMNEYIKVIQGKKSKNFQKYKGRISQDQEQTKSFSIVFSSRSLDLISQNEQEKIQFIQAVRSIRKFS